MVQMRARLICRMALTRSRYSFTRLSIAQHGPPALPAGRGTSPPSKRQTRLHLLAPNLAQSMRPKWPSRQDHALALVEP